MSRSVAWSFASASVSRGTTGTPLLAEVGEATGALQEMLNSLADFYDEEIETDLGRFVTLIEPLLRRATFLQEAVDALDLAPQVTVVRSRGEQATSLWAGFDVVTARAVAPLPKLLGWTVPLLRPGGRLLALKGQQASEELLEAAALIAEFGLQETVLLHIGAPWVDPPTTVVSGFLGGAQ